MKNTSRRRSARATDALPPEVGILLEEIEKEPVPERLLELARRLQDALARKRAREAAEAGSASHAVDKER